MLAKYTDLMLAHRWKVVMLWLFVMVACVAGLTRITFSSDYRVFFGADNPELLAFTDMQNTFDSSDNVLIVLRNRDGSSIFSESSAQALLDITQRAWQTPYSSRVDSLSNYQFSRAQADELAVADLIRAEDLSASALNEAQIAALSERTLVNRLVSADGKVAAVNITVRLPGKMREAEVPDVAVYIESLLQEIRAEYPAQEFFASGQIMMNNTLVEASQFDMGMLFPLTLLVIIIGTGIFVRSAVATLGVFSVLIMSILAAIGVTGWLGIQMTPPAASAPTIILTLVVADCMHLLSTYYFNLRNGMQKMDAMRNSVMLNFKAIFITSLTTVLGFMTLNFSDSPPFRDLGNITAMGVVAAFLLAISFLPALVSLFPAKVYAAQNTQNVKAQRYVDWLQRNKQAVLVSLVLVSAFIVYAIPKNKIDDNFYDYFGEHFATRQANDFIFDNLTGIATLEYAIDSGSEMGIAEPEFLKKVEAFSAWFEKQPQVYNVNVITDTFKRLNKNMHGDDPAYARLPETRELAAQYLLLYELSLPFGLNLDNQLTADKSALRMVVTLKKGPSSQLLLLDARAHAWLQEQGLEKFTGAGVSPDMMFAKIGYRNNHALLWGALVALVVISLTLIVVFRNVKIGLISLIPNLYPAGIAFAIWGIIIGEVGLSLSVVATMTLGIVVDDTVHFLNKYMHATRSLGMATRDALVYAFHTVGRALIGTTLVLSLGFMVLAASPFRLNSDMGLMTAITIVIALVLDLIVLPVLLLALDRHQAAQPLSVQEDVLQDLPAAEKKAV